MRALIFIGLFLVVANTRAQQQDSLPLPKEQVDTLIIGSWKMENPAQMKILRVYGDRYLAESIQFLHRQEYISANRNMGWRWSYSDRSGELEIADLEVLEVQAYKVALLTEEKLVLMIGRQEIIFLRVK